MPSYLSAYPLQSLNMLSQRSLNISAYFIAFRHFYIHGPFYHLSPISIHYFLLYSQFLRSIYTYLLNIVFPAFISLKLFCCFVFFYFFTFLLLFKYSCLHFLECPHHSPHFLPLILTPFGFVHVSFTHAPWWPFPLPSHLLSGYCQFVLNLNFSGSILFACLFCWLGSTYR